MNAVIAPDLDAARAATGPTPPTPTTHQPPIRARSPRPRPPPRPRILIVDDEPDIAYSYCRLLQDAFPTADVEAETSVGVALSRLQQDRVDLIVSDYRMPVMDGLSFLAKAQGLQPAARRVLVTAYADEDLERQAGGPGGIDLFFPKSGDPGMFLRRLAALLEG